LGPVEASCKHGNEPSGFIKDGKFMYVLSDSGLTKVVLECHYIFTLSSKSNLCDRGKLQAGRRLKLHC